MRRVTVLSIIVTVFVLFFNGCATGPRYEYTKQEDSAAIVGPGVPSQGVEGGTSLVILKQVDGMVVNFLASDPIAPFPSLFSKEPLYVASGKHAISLNISEIDTVTGIPGPRKAGAYGDVITSWARPTITAAFTVNHLYRLTAVRSGSYIYLTLWDETGNLATPSRVGNWTFASNLEYHQE